MVVPYHVPYSQTNDFNDFHGVHLILPLMDVFRHLFHYISNFRTLSPSHQISGSISHLEGIFVFFEPTTNFNHIQIINSLAHLINLYMV